MPTHINFLNSWPDEFKNTLSEKKKKPLSSILN